MGHRSPATRWLLLAAIVAAIAVVSLLRSEDAGGSFAVHRGQSETADPAAPSSLPNPESSDAQTMVPAVVAPTKDVSARARSQAVNENSDELHWIEFEVVSSTGSAVVGATVEIWVAPTLPLPTQGQAHSVEPAVGSGHAGSTVATNGPPVDREADASDVTGGDGRCRLQYPAGELCIFSASEVSIGWSGYRAIQDDVAGPIRVELSAPRHVTGRVIDARGTPIPNALVRFRPEAPVRLPRASGQDRISRDPPDLVTDGEGRFCVEVDSLYWGFVWAESGPRHSGMFNLLGATDIDLMISAGYEITGLVLGPGGTPLTNALVRVIRPSAMPFGSPLEQVGTRDDPAGTFFLRVENAGVYAVFADDTQHQLTTCDIARVSLSEAQPSAEVRLQLCPMLTIEGRVVDETRNPVRGLDLVPRIVSPRFANFSQVQAGEPDVQPTRDDGTFLFAGLQPGVSYNLIAYGLGEPGQVTGSAVLAESVPSGTTGLELVLSRVAHHPWTLHGRVVEADSGNPVASYQLRVKFALFGAEIYFPENEPPLERLEGGEFVLRGLSRSKAYRLVVTSEPGVDEIFPLDPPTDSTEASATFEVGSHSRVWVHVRDEQDRSVVGAAVDIIPKFMLFDPLASPVASMTSTTDGVAVEPLLRAGKYLIQVNRVEDRASGLLQLIVENGSVSVPTVRIMNAGSAGVQVRATDEQGRPLSGVRVILNRRGLPTNACIAEGLTDSAGEFTAAGLTPGIYWVRCSSEVLGDLHPDPDSFVIWGSEAIDVKCQLGF